MSAPHRPGLVVAGGLSALLGLAACTTPQPASQPLLPLPASVASSWQTPQTPPQAGAGAAVDAAWWSRFDDPLLPALVQAAQAASPTLASAAASIERARADRTAAAAAGLPQLDATASAIRSRQLPATPATGSASAGLQAGWEIDLFGAVAAGRSAADARLAGAQAALQDVRIALAAEAASSYVQFRACEAQAEQARLDAASREETARITDLSARAGFTAPADAALVRAGAAQARSQASSQRASCQTLLKSLVELTDLPEADLRTRLQARAAVVPTAPPVALAVLPAALMVQRPDMAQAARNVEAAAADVAQSQARQRPQVRVSGNLAAALLRSGGESTSGSTWSFGPLSVSFPLFDGGSRAAATDAARADYTAAVAAYQAQARRAVREVEAALVALQSVAEREADASAAAADFEAALRATQARQRGGLASVLDLELARRNAYSAQTALIDLRREKATTWITLYRALGGGWAGDGTALSVATPTSHASAQP